MRRHDVTAVRHRLPTTLAVSSSGPYPRLNKKTPVAPGPSKKRTGCGGWVFVFGTAVVARSRPWVNLGTLSECKEMTQVQVNDGRSFLCVWCGYFGRILWCHSFPHTERNALASLGRCPPSRSIETPFPSAALRRTRLLFSRLGNLPYEVRKQLRCLFGDPSHRSVGLKEGEAGRRFRDRG